MSDETLKQNNDAVLTAIADLSKQINGRLDVIEKRLAAHDAQFEAIRTGLVANGIDFERLSAKVIRFKY